MGNSPEIDDLILRNIQELPEPAKTEVLHFIEYLRIKEDQPFIDYVNERTSMALADKEKGEGVITLSELQSEYE